MKGDDGSHQVLRDQFQIKEFAGSSEPRESESLKCECCFCHNMVAVDDLDRHE